MKRMLVLGACIILSSAIISISNINEVFSPDNVLFLDSGKVRLGKVYREILTSSYEVTLKGESSPSTSITASTKDLYTNVHKNLLDNIKSLNEEREKNKQEVFTVDSVYWTEDATVKLVTQVTYQSEFQPDFVLTIDQTTLDYFSKAYKPKNISSYISDLKAYSASMLTKYEKNHSFINQLTTN